MQLDFQEDLSDSGPSFTIAERILGNCLGFASVDVRSAALESGQNNVKITFYLLFYFNRSNCFLIH